MLLAEDDGTALANVALVIGAASDTAVSKTTAEPGRARWITHSKRAIDLCLPSRFDAAETLALLFDYAAAGKAKQAVANRAGTGRRRRAHRSARR